MNLKVADAKREDGFTLIELLVVVIIIGILAAIAIPVFLNQRERAREAAVESTLRSAATYMEIVLTDSGTDTYPTTIAALTDEGLRLGDVTITDGDITPDNTAKTYCIDAVHSIDNTVLGHLDSTVGAPEIGTTC